MTIKFGMVMDPIDLESGSYAILCEAVKRGYEVYFIEQENLFIHHSSPFALTQRFYLDPKGDLPYFLGKQETTPLTELDVIFMRKDPPVDMQFIHATHIIELAEKAGVLVVNSPRSLRDANEKLFVSWFPEYCPPHIVTNKASLLHDFLSEHHEIVLKKLNSMSSKGVFHLHKTDFNKESLIALATENESEFVMAQKFLPEIFDGDKRILLIDGELVAPYSFLRIPAKGDFRGNIDSGATKSRANITAHEKNLIAQIGPILREKGLFFVSIDMIGNYISEINVTSIGLIGLMSELFEINLPKLLLIAIEKKLT